MVGAGALLLIPCFQSFSLPLCLRCPLAAPVFQGLEVPSCTGVLLLACGVCFPVGQGVAVPSKPN